jgi:hypothetical protein
MDTMVMILEREPPPLCELANTFYAAPAPLQQVIHKALRKDATERYQTTTELLSDLNIVTQLLKTATPFVSNDQLKIRRQLKQENAVIKGGRRHQAWPMIAVALLTLAIAGTLIYRRASLPIQPNAGAPASATNVLYSQRSEREQLDFVREQEQRISAMMGDRQAKLNEEALLAIKLQVDRYLARDAKARSEGGESLKDIYARAPPYLPLIARSFAARRVPVIIGIYLPMIESAYRPCFENDYGSKGLFQFLPQTAKLYGVSREEMCDAEKMTPAAAHYIADHMAELGDDAESITLVLLSYNRGATWVRTTLRELRGTANYERNFWTLFAHRDELDAHFRSENAGYVPNFFAAAIIGENPQTFGLSMPALSAQASER